MGEYGLAVEVVAERLGPGMPRQLTSELAAGLLDEAKLMQLPDETREPLEALTLGEPPGST